MKFEIGGFMLWVLVYIGMKTLVEAYADTSNWFFLGAIAGIICGAIIRGVAMLRKEFG
jgi:hypothetical protein